MESREIEIFVEAALLAAGRPLNIDQLQGLFDGRSAPEKSEIRDAIKALNEQYDDRGIEINEVASGFRMQIRSTMTERLQKLWEERPPRYSRALFETLALIAYRQPITRGEIEEIRGVSVSSNIMRSLVEREWVRVVGHRDVPGRPAMFGTTKAFLDYFSLKRLEDLPELSDLSDWESLRVQLDLPDVDDSDDDGVSNIAELPVSNDDGASAEQGDREAVASGAVETGDGSDAVHGSDDPQRTDDADATAGAENPPADAVADDSASEDEEELVVSEWPSPGGEGSIATLEVDDPDHKTGSNKG